MGDLNFVREMEARAGLRETAVYVETDAQLSDGLPVRVRALVYQPPGTDFNGEIYDPEISDLQVFWPPGKNGKLYPCNRKLSEADIEAVEVALLETEAEDAAEQAQKGEKPVESSFDITA